MQGPGGVGQFELALGAGAGWLCEPTPLPLGERPCGACAECRLVARRARIPICWCSCPRRCAKRSAGPATQARATTSAKSSKKKPSKEIRVEAIRAAIAFAATTSARGRGKVVVVHPAERMNPVAGQRVPEDARGAGRRCRASCCAAAAPDALLPTIRSRCQDVALPCRRRPRPRPGSPSRASPHAEVLLAGSGGQPQEALRLGRQRRRRRRLARACRGASPRGDAVGAARLAARLGSSTRCRSSATTPPRWPAAARRATFRAPA